MVATVSFLIGCFYIILLVESNMQVVEWVSDVNGFVADEGIGVSRATLERFIIQFI